MYDFFVEVFPEQELRSWVERNYGALAPKLPGRAASLSEFAWGYIEQARRHGYIDALFFQRLAQQFSRRRRDVEQLYEVWCRSTGAAEPLRHGSHSPLLLSCSLHRHTSTASAPAHTTLVLQVHNVADEVTLRNLVVRPKLDDAAGDMVAGEESIQIDPTYACLPYLRPGQRVKLAFDLIRPARDAREFNLDLDIHCMQPFELLTPPLPVIVA